MTDNSTRAVHPSRRPRKAKEAAPKGPRESRWTDTGGQEGWRRHADASRWTNDDFLTGLEDRFKIDAESIANIEREGIKLQWWTDTVYGDSSISQVATAERNGWERVSKADRFPGVTEVEKGGQVLMARPMAIHKKAEARERVAAAEKVALKEEALISGNIPGISLEASQHPSTRKTRKIKKSWERLDIPAGED